MFPFSCCNWSSGEKYSLPDDLEGRGEHQQLMIVPQTD